MRTTTEVGRWAFTEFCYRKRSTVNSKPLTEQWGTVMTLQHCDTTESIRVGERSTVTVLLNTRRKKKIL